MITYQQENGQWVECSTYVHVISLKTKKNRMLKRLITKSSVFQLTMKTCEKL